MDQISTENIFMAAAYEEARKAFDMGEVPVGAVTVKDGEVLMRAHNMIEQLNDATAHAEMLVLKKSAAYLGRWRLNDLDLYVSVEPCPMCAMAMVLSRIRRVVFGAMEPRTGAGGSFIDLLKNPVLNHQIEVISGVMAEESADLLKRFFKSRRYQA